MPMPTIEKREIRYTPQSEVRAVERDGVRTISGNAITFSSRSENLGGFTETIDPSALDETDMSDVVALFNHSPDHVLGRTTSGTLRLTRTSAGLAYEIDLPDTQVARDLYTSIARGDVRGSSFAFEIGSDGDEWQWNDAGGVHSRNVRKISRIWDVSAVTYPAYRASDVMVAKRCIEAHPKIEAPQKRNMTDEELRISQAIKLSI